MPSKILLDTNFLLVPLRFGVDVFDESENALNDSVEFYVSSRVIDEIRLKMRDAKPGLEKEMLFALKMAGQCSLVNDSSKNEVDESLIDLAERHDLILATTDSELRKRARKRGVKVLYLRQKRYLLLDG